MRHFRFLDDAERDVLFAQPPERFGVDTGRHELGLALGAVLYTPATRPGVARALLGGARAGLTTQVLCLEDAVADHELADGERRLAHELAHLARAVEDGDERAHDLPLLFVRARSPRHVRALARDLGELRGLLAGVVLPKLSCANGRAYLEAVAASHDGWWAVPVLEGPEILHHETRRAELDGLAKLLHEFRAGIPCLRLGATDLSGLYGIRRPPDLTIYDIGVVRDCIADVVNVLGRPGSGHVISGPAWEYFRPGVRVLKPQLRESTFTTPGRLLRRQLVAHGLDGLVRELLLDRANGLEGKTVIHPSHIAAVNAMSAVSHEDHLDAQAIAASADGGAVGSRYANKMNEPKPHREWARRVLRRARVFGVLAEGVSHMALLEASLRDRTAVTG